MPRDGWSHSMKRAGAYFISPDKGMTWTQELPGCVSPEIREAVRLSQDFFWKTYNDLSNKSKEKEQPPTPCRECGQPMLPPGALKLPNEYDHAQGCPLAQKDDACH